MPIRKAKVICTAMLLFALVIMREALARRNLLRDPTQPSPPLNLFPTLPSISFVCIARMCSIQQPGTDTCFTLFYLLCT